VNYAPQMKKRRRGDREILRRKEKEQKDAGRWYKKA